MLKLISFFSPSSTSFSSEMFPPSLLAVKAKYLTALERGKFKFGASADDLAKGLEDLDKMAQLLVLIMSG